MMPKTPRNIGASVRARLLRLSRESGEDYQFILQRYAAERFLYRLGESEHRDNFVLKGAMLLALWGGGTYRPTRDLDFTAYGNSWEEHVRGMLQEICSIPAEDGIVFDSEQIRLESIRGQAAYNSFRAKLKASIGKTRMSLQLDIGFGNAVQPSPVDSEYTTLLDHPPPRIRIYPREAFVAEKLHAMVELGALNSRYKDFYDIYALTKHFAFDGRTLHNAVRATFQLRGTPFSEGQSIALTPQFYADTDRAQEWQRYLQRDGLKGAPFNFGIVGERLVAFLGEIWRTISQDAQFFAIWPKGGPWRHKPYSSYKESDVEWLGPIPAHWDVKRTKYLLAKNDSGVWGSDFDDEGTIVLRSTEQTIDGHWVLSDPAKRKLSVSEYLSSCLLEGDLVVTKSSGSSQHIGKTSIVTKEIESLNCCFSNFMQRLRVKENVAPRFAWYALNGDLGRKQFDYLSGTTSGLANLNGGIIGMVSLAIPPMHEQLAIAGFLDRQTAQIDALVAKKQRLIALLKEKRATLITHAVTKGLVPDVPISDFGGDWLDQIPAHWDVVRADSIFRYQKIQIEPAKMEEESVFHYSIPAIQEFGDGTIDSTHAIDSGKLKVEGRRILLSKLNPRKGVVCLAEEKELPTVCSTEFLPLEVRSCDWKWAFYVLSAESTRQRLSAAVRSATRSHQRVDTAEVLKMWHGVPPIQEQRAIANFLDSETAKVDALAGKVRGTVEQFKELRSALISAAVKGQIDVREALA